MVDPLDCAQCAAPVQCLAVAEPQWLMLRLRAQLKPIPTTMSLAPIEVCAYGRAHRRRLVRAAPANRSAPTGARN